MQFDCLKSRGSDTNHCRKIVVIVVVAVVIVVLSLLGTDLGLLFFQLRVVGCCRTVSVSVVVDTDQLTEQSLMLPICQYQSLSADVVSLLLLQSASTDQTSCCCWLQCWWFIIKTSVPLLMLLLLRR